MVVLLVSPFKSMSMCFVKGTPQQDGIPFGFPFKPCAFASGPPTNMVVFLFWFPLKSNQKGVPSTEDTLFFCLNEQHHLQRLVIHSTALNVELRSLQRNILHVLKQSQVCKMFVSRTAESFVLLRPSEVGDTWAFCCV